MKLRAGSRNQFFDNTDSGGRDLEREFVLLLFASPHGQSASSDDVSKSSRSAFQSIRCLPVGELDPVPFPCAVLRADIPLGVCQSLDLFRSGLRSVAHRSSSAVTANSWSLPAEGGFYLESSPREVRSGLSGANLTRTSRETPFRRTGRKTAVSDARRREGEAHVRFVYFVWPDCTGFCTDCLHLAFTGAYCR